MGTELEMTVPGLWIEQCFPNTTGCPFKPGIVPSCYCIPQSHRRSISCFEEIVQMFVDLQKSRPVGTRLHRESHD